MAIQRLIDFVTEMHGMRASRVHTPTPLRTPEGGFDKRAIMREAWRQARRFCAGMTAPERGSLWPGGVWESARKEGPHPSSPAQIARRFSRPALLATA